MHGDGHCQAGRGFDSNGIACGEWLRDCVAQDTNESVERYFRIAVLPKHPRRPTGTGEQGYPEEARRLCGGFARHDR